MLLSAFQSLFIYELVLFLHYSSVEDNKGKATFRLLDLWFIRKVLKDHLGPSVFMEMVFMESFYYAQNGLKVLFEAPHYCLILFIYLLIYLFIYLFEIFSWVFSEIDGRH